MATTPVLEDTKMRELGFTDHREGYWYYTTRVASHTSFNVMINKETGEWQEDVLDEFFLQPAPYMDAKPEFKNEVIGNVDKEVARLNDAGLTISVDHNAYSWVK